MSRFLRDRVAERENFLLRIAPKETPAAPPTAVNPEFLGFSAKIWPVAQAYASPLNPLFLGSLIHIRQLESKPHWLVRDGALPLHWFFKTHPRPGARPSRLFIHEDLQSLVPEAWHDHVGTYRLHQQSPSRQATSLLAVGLSVKDSDDLANDVRGAFKDISRKKILDLQPYAFLPWTRLDRPATTPAPKTPRAATALLNKYFSKPVIAQAWPQMTKQISYGRFALLEVHSRLIYADSFFTHLPLCRGASLLSARALSRRERYVALSPHHGMAVCETLERRSRKDENARWMRALTKAQSKLTFNWNELMSPWHVPTR